MTAMTAAYLALAACSLAVLAIHAVLRHRRLKRYRQALMGAEPPYGTLGGQNMAAAALSIGSVTGTAVCVGALAALAAAFLHRRHVARKEERMLLDRIDAYRRAAAMGR